LTPFLVLRSLFFGSGGYVQGRFVTSPRQFFVKAVASRRVPRDHPFVALGKKSHAGIGWARFHVCNGEATRADVSTFLRQAVTSWLVRCADLGILEHVPSLTGPIEQARRLAGPPDRPWALELTDGRRLSAIEYFRTYYLPAITQLVAGRGAVDREALSLFIRVLERLEMRDFASLSRTLDWCIKYDIFEMHADEYFDLDGRMLTAGDRQTLDNQYRAVTDSFFEEIEGELEIERIVEESRVTEAVGSPPPGTRAETRVQIAQRARNQIAGMDWDQINFKDGTIVMLESLEASDGMIAKAMSSGLFS
jgi:Pup-ligase protein.